VNKTTLYLPDEIQQWLRAEAKRTRRSQAELVRTALEELRARAPRAVPRSIGMGRSDGEVTGASSEEWLEDQWSDPV